MGTAALTVLGFSASMQPVKLGFLRYTTLFGGSIAALLAGASIVHWAFQPDLVR